MGKLTRKVKSRDLRTTYPEDDESDISADFNLFSYRGRKVIEINIWV